MFKCVITLILISTFQNVSHASFFENTRRRPSVVEEKKYLVEIGRCTGFFVKNDLNKNFVVTARHCLKYAATDFCNNKGKAYDVKHGIFRTCQEVVAGSASFDIVLLSFDGPKRDKRDGLTLANFNPQAFTRVKTVGFPGDPYAHSGANTSENCWTLSSEIFFPYADDPKSRDPAIYYNCSTYGGNSGGPVIIEGSDVVVGLPFQYIRENYGNLRPNKRKISFNLMSNFVNLFYNELSVAGVKIESLSNIKGFDSKYFKSGYYRSPITTQCILVVDVIYNTGKTLKRLEVEATGPVGTSCSGSAIYTCSADECAGDDGTKIILKSDGFNLINVNGDSTYFSI